MKILKLLPLFFLLLAGCGVLPLAPGNSSFSNGTTRGELRQSQNPKTESTQKYRRTEEAGKTTEEIETVVGSAQKDTAREMAAKLGSLKGIVWLGVLVFLVGAASFAWPPLKAIVGSVTTSAVITLAGLSLIVLPTLIVGNEILILCVALGGAALYFFAHRHASVHSKLKTLVEPRVTLTTGK